MGWRFLLLVLLSCGSNTAPNLPEAGTDGAVTKDASPKDAIDELSPDAVAGTVVDESVMPIAGATVRVGASTVTTDSSGQFIIHGVGASYDALVVNEVYGIATFASYVGLTTRTPTLRGYAQTGWSTKVNGTISPAPSTTEHLALAFDSTSIGHCDPTSVGYAILPNGTFTIPSVDCFGAQTITGTTYALAYGAGTGWLPSTIYGFGQSNLTMNVSGTNSVGTIPMSAPAQGSISITTTGSPTLTGFALGARFNVGSHGHLDFAGSAAQATVATLATTGATVGVSAIAHTAPPEGGSGYLGTPGWWQVQAFEGALSPSSGTVTLTMPSPFSTSAPADGTTGVGPTATVSWQTVPNAAYQVNIGCYANNVEVYSGIVLTGTAQASVPNEPSLNVSVPSGATCYWGVTASGPATSVDDFASGSLSPQNVLVWSELPVTGFDVVTPLVAFVEQ